MAPPTTRSTGIAGERAAIAHLAAGGFRVIDTNFRTREGELDVVAIDSQTLIFCEVKARLGARAAGRALEGIGPAKRRRIRAMARIWLSERAPLLGGWRGHDIRFDAIGVGVDQTGRVLTIEHVEDAF